MPPKTRTVIPADPDDLVCDTCPERYHFRGNLRITIESARVVGWHVLPGQPLKVLCPSCIGTPRTKVPAPAVLDGQVDLLAELGVQVTPVEKTKRKKGREVS